MKVVVVLVIVPAVIRFVIIPQGFVNVQSQSIVLRLRIDICDHIPLRFAVSYNVFKLIHSYAVQAVLGIVRASYLAPVGG